MLYLRSPSCNAMDFGGAVEEERTMDKPPNYLSGRERRLSQQGSKPRQP